MYLKIRLMPVCLMALSCGLLSAEATADIVPDQYQIGWQGSAAPLEIGGHLRQRLAQTLTAGVTGGLQRVELLIGCDDSTAGEIHVEIQSVTAAGEPAGIVLGSAAVDSLFLVPPAGQDYEFHRFQPTGVEQVAGTSYAIVIWGDEGTICYTPRGPVEGSMFAYPYGDAYQGEQAGDSVIWSRITDPVIDLVFRTFVRVVDGPDYCDVVDATGTPNDWLPEDAPACSCLEDPVLNAYRCWFGLPDFVLWREIIPNVDSEATLEWHVLPLNSGIEEIFVQESGIGGAPQVVSFSKSLKPGKSQSQKFDGVSPGTVSEVSVLFSGPRGDAEVRFRVELEPSAAGNSIDE